MDVRKKYSGPTIWSRGRPPHIRYPRPRRPLRAVSETEVMEEVASKHLPTVESSSSDEYFTPPSSPSLLDAHVSDEDDDENDNIFVDARLPETQVFIEGNRTQRQQRQRPSPLRPLRIVGGALKTPDKSKINKRKRDREALVEHVAKRVRLISNPEEEETEEQQQAEEAEEQQQAEEAEEQQQAEEPAGEEETSSPAGVQAPSENTPEPPAPLQKKKRRKRGAARRIRPQRPKKPEGYVPVPRGDRHIPLRRTTELEELLSLADRWGAGPEGGRGQRLKYPTQFHGVARQ